MSDTESPLAGYAHAEDGTALACQRRGTGFPLVLLAGQANNHHWWDGLREDFHGTHSTITLDYRGTGASDKPQGGYSTRQFAEDVIAVLDHLGIERADVYGTSMGGRVAQWVAADHPERVRPGARHAYFEECRPEASALVAAFLGHEEQPDRE
ncbi:alpha/beta hydrolase family protein [Streptomyces sp. BK340]|nr:alpha/beta hydrolase family protein [Streptomyces sp. BK340]